MVTQKTPKEIAIHEAGHAIICLALGITIDEIRIAGGDEITLGEAVPNKDSVSSVIVARNRGMFYACLTLLGGICAEQVYHKDVQPFDIFWRDVKNGLRSDDISLHNDVALLLEVIASQAKGIKPKRSTFVVRCYEIVHAILQKRWAQVEQLSEALVKKGVLNTEEIAEALAMS